MKPDTRVNVSILDKEYQVTCPIEERAALFSAAQELDARMRKVRNAGAVIGADRIAVMVALNLCHELQQAQTGEGAKASSSALEHIVQRLDQALNSPEAP